MRRYLFVRLGACALLFSFLGFSLLGCHPRPARPVYAPQTYTPQTYAQPTGGVSASTARSTTGSPAAQHQHQGSGSR